MAGVSGSWAEDLGDGLTTQLPPTSADARPTLLVTTVDIGEGRSGRIEIREGDEPTEVAWTFCRMHGLPDAIVGPLAAHLQENIDHESEGGGMDEVRKACRQLAWICLVPFSPLPNQQQPGSHSLCSHPQPPSCGPASACGADAAVEEHCLQQQQKQQQQEDLVPAAAAEQQQQQYAMQQQEQQRNQERTGIDPASSFKRKLAAHREQQRAMTAAAAQQQQQRNQDGVWLERSRSLPSENPSKGGIDGLAGAACGPLVTFRPASSNSAISAAYYGGPGGGSASAHARQLGYQVTRGGGDVVTRLYRDAFRKQARLEEERRLRCAKGHGGAA